MKYVLYLILFTLVLTKKKKLSSQSDPKSVKPVNYDAHVYCNACQAIVRETLHKIKDSKSELNIMDAISTVCRTNFQGYAYNTKTTRAGCEVFLMGWNEVLEEELYKRKSNEGFEQYFCENRTQACLNIDPYEVQKFRKEMHKQKQPVEIDGEYYMPDENGYVDKVVNKYDL